MFTQGQTYLQRAFFSAAAVLLLLTQTGQSVLLTTAAPNATLTTQLSNSSVAEPQVQRVHRSCESEHENFCQNGGKCIYPQDSEKPFCICAASYSGQRCMFFTESTRTQPEWEELIGISFGVIMVIILLAILIYCCAYKRCKKSAPLIKSVPSETSV
ncbi:epigen [Parambassis ranga]|uniref:Epigen n=1 Tax=Parambassis ranga TaxID=210632 RepID=A0A6P7J0P2_9TELE|nr:epigen-like [Parambassis ranga]